jgi:hypothetical protein
VLLRGPPSIRLQISPFALKRTVVTVSCYHGPRVVTRRSHTYWGSHADTVCGFGDKVVERLRESRTFESPRVVLDEECEDAKGMCMIDVAL